MPPRKNAPRKKDRRGPWATWAHYQAVVGAAVVLLGALCGLVYDDRSLPVVNLIVSLLLLSIEYCDALRMTSVVNLFLGNFYLRMVLYLGFALPAMFFVPTMTGGICLILGKFF